MTPTLYLRSATEPDIDVMLAWRHETAKWITAHVGSDQWSVPYPRERLQMWIERGETVMASLAPGQEPIATITVSTWADPELWTQEERDAAAHYIYKANVLREQANQGIGRCLIDWARTRAARAGSRVVRCDVWSTNIRLQSYYLNQGFRHIRTVPGVNSGALLEITAAEIPGLPVVDTPSIARVDVRPSSDRGV